MNTEVEFLQAIKAGDVGKVRDMLKARPALLSIEGEDRMSPIITALRFGPTELVHLLAAERLRALKEGKVKHGDDLYRLIHDLGEAGFTDAEPDIVPFLEHEDPELRYIAVSVLTLHWDMARYRNEIERILVSDSEVHVRRMAVAGLGFVFRETRDPRATSLLLQKLRDAAEDGSVRRVAYEALLDVWLPESKRSRDRDARIQEGFAVLGESLTHAERLQKAMEVPEPFRDSELAELSEQSEKSGKEWEQRVDWDLVAAIERGEFPQ